MSGDFRKAMTPVHTWGGLVVGWVLFFVFVTGTLGYFDTEIDRWTKPEVPLQEVSITSSVDAALDRLSAIAPDADNWFIGLPGSRDFPNLNISWRFQDPPPGQAARGNELLNAETSTPFPYRDTYGGQTLYRMHYNLHYLPRAIGRYVVGVVSMFMLVAIVTGIVIHRKFFREFFTFRPKKGQRSWLDIHNVLSVLALPFHLMITYSGLLFFVTIYLPAVMLAVYGSSEDARERFIADMFPREPSMERAGRAAPLAPLIPMVETAKSRWGPKQIKSISVQLPGDANARITINRYLHSVMRASDTLVFDGVNGQLIKDKPVELRPTVGVYQTLLSLHEGTFADTPLRWLYFLSGVMGCAMIAAGLVLWSVKRNVRLIRRNDRPGAGHRLVEVLNIGTLVGLPVAIAAFFWANRLLPLQLAQRAEWELHVLFLTWLGMLVLAWLRPAVRAWTESMWLAATAFALIPLVNALTTDRHLGHSVATGDWVFAGFDLCMLVTGLGFAGTAWLRQHGAKSETVARTAASHTTCEL